MNDEEARLLVKDLREVGVVVERCQGCGKIACDGCPCGTTTTVDLQALSPTAADALRKIWASRRTSR